MKPSLEALFATLKALSYPEQMKVSQAFTDIVDPYDSYGDSMDLDLFDPVRNPNVDIVGNLTNELINNYGEDDSNNEFENVFKQALANRSKYGSF